MDNNIKIEKFNDLQKEFEKMFLFADPGILKLLIATIVGNQLDNDPIWLMTIAPSSGGKSELINTLDSIEIAGQNLIYPISDLTTNTFASGLKRTGKETSLLFRVPMGGILTFKDFTSMLSKRSEDRTVIMGQMREIYDQKYVKETGNGDSIKWEGKIGALAASTEIIYQFLEDLSAMGDRFIMYSVKQPKSIELARFYMEYKKSGRSKEKDRNHLKECVKSYVEFIINNLVEEKAELSEDSEEDIIEVSDFCTKARSGVIINERRGHIDFVPSREMPVRMMEQLLSISKTFIIMRVTEDRMNGIVHKDDIVKKELNEIEKEIIYKIAFDSIPIKRRIALKSLAKYEGGVTTKGLAISLNYPTPTVSGWLSQLNGLGICSREIRMGAKGDLWKMHNQYRKIMVKFENIEVTSDSLDNSDDTSNDAEDAWDTYNNEVIGNDEISW